MASRLPYDKMTTEEVSLFRDIVDDDSNIIRTTSLIESYKTFLIIRNKIVNFKFLFKCSRNFNIIWQKLQMWVDNPKVQLVIEDVLNKFDAQTVKSKYQT